MNHWATIDSRSMGYLIYEINLSSNLYAPGSVVSFDIDLITMVIMNVGQWDISCITSNQLELKLVCPTVCRFPPLVVLQLFASVGLRRQALKRNDEGSRSFRENWSGIMIVINIREKDMPDPFCSGWTLQLELQTCSALLSRASHRVLHIVKMSFHFSLSYLIFFKSTLMAQKTDAARKRGGSPTALLEYTALGFVAPLMRKKLNHYHLHHCCHYSER